MAAGKINLQANDGKAVPQEVLDKRAEARVLINELEE